MSKIFCVQFWFCAFSETTKSCLTLKIISSNLPGKILSFESISVVISQKLSELDQFNIGSFFFPSRYFDEIRLQMHLAQTTYTKQRSIGDEANSLLANI